MDPLTRTRPKVMLPVAGKPMLEHLVNNAVAAGFRDITLLVHAFQDQVREHFADHAADIHFVEQGEPQGTGHAVACLHDAMDGPFALASGDSYLATSDLQKLRGASHASVGAFHVDDARPYGLLDVEGDLLVGVQEKPKDATPGPINTGTYFVDDALGAACHDLKPSPRGELEFTDALAAHGDVRVLPLETWIEAGRPWDLLDMQAAIMEGMAPQIDGEVSNQAELIGPVHVAAGAEVLGATRIEGPVWIGPGAKVGPHSYIRGSTAIGAHCHVGASVEIKNSIIMDNSNVPHLSYVGDSVIGQHCNLGAGSTTANLKVNDQPVGVKWQGETWIDTGRRKLGIIAGDHVKTGINCSFNPGTVFGANCMTPAGTVWSGWVEPDADGMAKMAPRP